MQTDYRKTLGICCLAYISQAIVVNLAPLLFIVFRRDYGASYAFLAGTVLYTFAIQIFVDFVSVRFVGIIGYRALALMSQIASAVGLFMLSLLPSIMSSFSAAFLISVTFYSIGGGLAEVVISPICDSLPSESKSGSMSFLHSFYSWGQVLVILLTTLIISLIGDSRWQIVPLIWAVIPIINIIGFLRVPIPEVKSEEKGGLMKIAKSPFFLLAILLMICSGAAEQSIAQWASLFAEKGLGFTKVTGDLFGPCLFAAFMGIGRTAFGVLGDRINITKALMSGSLLTVAGYIAAVFSPWAPLALGGCALSGFGVSILWPGMLTYSSKRFPTGGGAMFALLALGGDVGCSVGPWLSGFVSDRVLASGGIQSLLAETAMDAEQIGLRCGILAAIVFPAVMSACFIILNIRRKRTADISDN